MVVRSSCSGRSSLRPFRGYRPVGGLACAPPRPRIARSGGRASGGQRRVPGRASGASPPGPAHDHGQHARGAGPESNPVRVDGGPRSRYNDRQAIRHRDPLAQSVEHLTFNQGVAGSIPARVTKLPCEGGISRGILPSDPTMCISSAPPGRPSHRSRALGTVGPRGGAQEAGVAGFVLCFSEISPGMSTRTHLLQERSSS